MDTSCASPPAVSSVPSSAESSGNDGISASASSAITQARDNDCNTISGTTMPTNNVKQEPVPTNSGVMADSSTSSSAAAAASEAADASAMPPPPPPAAPGSARTIAPSSTAAQVAACASSSSSSSPSSRPPTTTSIPAGGAGTAANPTTAAARPTQQKAGSCQTVASSSVPPAAAARASSLQSSRSPSIPQPATSSSAAHSLSSSSANRVVPLPQTQPQPRLVPKYIAKTTTTPPSTTTTSSATAVATTPSNAVANGRPGPSTTAVNQQQSNAPAAAVAHHHRPPVVASASAVAQHHLSHLTAASASATTTAPSPPSPSPDNTCSSVGGGGCAVDGGVVPSNKKKGGQHPLRRGKWTTEEEAYASRLINEFKSGLLPLTDGTTLRNFLSKLLNCDPMRISKKFVGNNCIGKQVFRRRVADINRLSGDQIERMRVELSELERRFYDRVAQTNRVKTPGIAGAMTNGATMTTMVASNAAMINMNIGGNAMREEMELENRPPTPPWLRPPSTYRPRGRFAEKTSAGVPPSTFEEAPSKQQKVSVSSTPPLVEVKSDTENAMEVIQRSGSSLRSVSSLARLAQAAEDIPRTESALEQLARTASAAKFVEDIVNGDSSLDTEVMGKRFSRSMLQGSFEALMSMDIQSVENLVELAAVSNSSAILSELNKNYNNNLRNNQSSVNLSTRMESFIKSLSNANLHKYGLSSQQALESLFNASSSSIFDAEKFSRRVDSSAGFSQLRVEGGIASGSHDSVEDFLSLVASGDIPHQDPNMLQVPLQKVMEQSGYVSKGGPKRKLSQHQLVALASRLAGSSASLTDMTKVSSALKKRKNK